MSHQTSSLQHDNTLGLAIHSRRRVVAEKPEDILLAWQQSHADRSAFLLLGGGSNVLFLDDFTGTVVLNRISGIQITEHDDCWELHVGAGENWHALVELTLKKGMAGLENLALIPGMTGSAPIQNIGAYGVEFKDFCQYVDVLDLDSSDVVRLSRDECRFGYRDSIFKHQYQHGFAIVAVGLRLAKAWRPVMTYGDLTRLDPATVTPLQIFSTVCQMRESKLPDPRVLGNVGSFFKNPLVSAEQAAELRQKYPEIPCYPQSDDSVKLAAGWLIDRCGLKGYRIGGAAVHQQQALVLINIDHATPADIVQLAHEVRQQVGENFNVWLEPEVRFIGAQGERNAVEVIS